MVYKYDFLIIGAGVAGMSYALKVAKLRSTRPTPRSLKAVSPV